MHIEAILHANNERDVAEDLEGGVRTLAARLGTARSARLYVALLALPFAAPVLLALRHSVVAALPLLTAPAAARLAGDFWHATRMYDLPKRTAKFQFGFGVLFVLGLLVPSPSIVSIVQSIARALRPLLPN